MRFHYPSFQDYFTRLFDESFVVYFHNYNAFITSTNRYFSTEKLKGLVWEAIEKSLDNPYNPPKNARLRSLIDAPIDTHMDALQDALLERETYIEKQSISGGGGEAIVYRVDLKMLERIVIDVRQEQDVELALHLIAGEIFMSDRFLEKKILNTVGVAFSNRRCRLIMHALEEIGAVKKNGNLRTAGREVMYHG